MADNDRLIGMRVQLRFGHPHATEFGTIESVGPIDGADAIKVKLELCPHGNDACYAWAGEWRYA